MIKLSDNVIIYHGDCLEVIKEVENNSVDAVVTDPPYGLNFMGKSWDHGVPGVPFWEAALQVAKPGAHLLAFGGTRTFHRLTCAIEDAGWEIRDCLMWVYGSGFPKSLNIGKAVDKLQGNERENLGIDESQAKRLINQMGHSNPTGTWKAGKRVIDITRGTSEWEGFGTALKPAWEPIILARKPIEGTVANNVLKWGCGGLNIEECRVGIRTKNESGRSKTGSKSSENRAMSGANYERKPKDEAGIGRFPANLLHDGSDEVMALFPESKGQCGDLKGHNKKRKSPNGCFGEMGPAVDHKKLGDSGSAARFFYCAKASKKDRDEGLEGEEKLCGMVEDDNYPIKTGSGNLREIKRKNNHPTVKPVELMKYLCRLITPPNGVILDPFMGSGSTGKAALREGFRFIGIDNDITSVEIAKARLEHEIKGRLF
jgi:DNA modification methylase